MPSIEKRTRTEMTRWPANYADPRPAQLVDVSGSKVGVRMTAGQ